MYICVYFYSIDPGYINENNSIIMRVKPFIVWVKEGKNGIMSEEAAKPLNKRKSNAIAL